MKITDLKDAQDFFLKYLEENNKEIKLSPDNWYDIFTIIAKYKALNLPVVSRSIGKDRKPVLKRLTKEQKKENDKECTYCIFYNGMGNLPICGKCEKENDADQYYG